MGSVCAEQQHHHKFHPHHHHHKPLQIPPCKLIGRKDAPAECRGVFSSEGAFRKYLPGGGDNSSDSDSDSDPYSSNHFRMFEFKVRRCTRSRSHDWTDCPFAHPGEKARRRDPRKYHYSGAVCAEHRRGTCSRGDNCEFSHGVFECWLHPSRYRTEACKDGKNCQRKVCFFAHTPKQLRVLPVEPDEPPPMQQDRKYQAEPVSTPLGKPHCCMLCHSINSFSSPRSTLLDRSSQSPPLSPSASLSPPLSPPKNRLLAGLPPAALCPDRFIGQSNLISSNRGGSNFSYEDVLNEIMSNFNSIQMNERMGNRNLAWLDIPNMVADVQSQFVLSPPTPSPSNLFQASIVPNKGLLFGDKDHIDGPGSTDPDIGWVDELLM